MPVKVCGSRIEKTMTRKTPKTSRPCTERTCRTARASSARQAAGIARLGRTAGVGLSVAMPAFTTRLRAVRARAIPPTALRQRLDA